MEFNIKKFRVGDYVEGTVYQVTKEAVSLDFGAFTEGTIYGKGLSLTDVSSCKDLVKEGQELDAFITKIDMERGQILLSRIKLLQNEKFKALKAFKDSKETFTVRVKKVVKGGLIATKDSVDMFLPVSQISTKRVNAEDYLNKELEVELIEATDRKLVISHKTIEARMIKEATEKEFATFKKGQVLKGTVSKIVTYGAFIRFENVEGLIHISELSHHRVENVSDILKENQEIEVKIINIDKKKLSLSMKALQKSPWEIFAAEFKKGDEVTGKVIRKTGNQMLVEVAKGVIGVISKRDYSWDPRFNLATDTEVGNELTLKITDLNVTDKILTLSKKHLEYNPWQDVTVKENDEVMATVKELQTNGALVSIQGVNAFLPIGEISTERVNQVSDALKVEDAINVIITKLDKRNWKMVVSKKQLTEQKAHDEYAKYLETEEQVSNTTLGDLFKDQLDKFKK
ncbi:hypothetical protein CI105_08785 [Candidatus Izimaplasma bacterium ZiA1]|uniref:S1 RNA-binding domain-containing protein n=1 Tax=Candidatus Izimoplasma sp. ZiA1 TaxID=2024899 RepID=UPI000BAA4F4A|nr:hypothetical protein CI105_08785 [Candidatus Izimaplasma bacterium ZiA1]